MQGNAPRPRRTLTLRAIADAFAVTPPSLVDMVAFNGHVNAKDRATGKAIRPCLVSLRASRDTFEDLVLVVAGVGSGLVAASPVGPAASVSHVVGG